MLEEILEANKEFVDNFEPVSLGHLPEKKVAILTCMDCRLTGFLPNALGISRGDAKIIRNAGNTIVGEDAIRSIAAAIYSLGCEEVLVVGHTECGMAHANPDAVKSKMIEMGIDEADIEAVGDLATWIGAIPGEEQNVLETVETIKNHPLISSQIPIHGLIMDITTGEVEVLIDGRE